MNYIRQLIYDMRNQKMMTWVSICGTAVSIFLVLVFFMVDSLTKVEVAPETRRHLIYGANQFSIKITGGERNGWGNNSQFSYPYARRLFENLDGVEAVSYVTDAYSMGAATDTGLPISASVKCVDGNFWKLYDFDFMQGRSFTEEECLDKNVNPIVLSDRLARSLFGSTEVLDRFLSLNSSKFFVVGVIENTSPILSNTFYDAFIPLHEGARKTNQNLPEFAGNGYITALLLFKEGVDMESVMRQINSRLATINSELKDLNVEASIPYINTPEDMVPGNRWIWDNNINSVVDRHYLVYLLLLLLPAINLNSMMRGRMQHRISEMGVRRAFGAKRRDIILQLLGENLLVTVTGGVIGLVLSYLFMMFLSSSFIMMPGISWNSSLAVKLYTPTFEMLFTWKSFVLALGACLVLNILTASLPAWRASAMPPSAAISKSRT